MRPPGSASTSTGYATGFTAGVSVEAVRRLGHASTETTQLYTLLDDQVADAEIRAARRRRDRAARPRNDITPYDPGGEQEHSP